MRLLFITHCAALSGAELLLTKLLPVLDGHIEVLALEHGPLLERLSQLGIAASVLPMDTSIASIRREEFPFAAIRSAYSLVETILAVARHRRNADITIAFSQKAFVICALGQFLVRQPLVWGLNDILSQEHFASTMRKCAIFLANATAKLVIVNSRATLDAFRACGGREDLARVVYPGVALNDVLLATDSNVPPRKSALLVGCFGRLAPWKGQAVLLRALSKLRHVDAWIVGAALFGEEDYERHLKEMVVELDLCERVQFLGYRADVPDLMAACDIIVHTSTSPEPFGQVVVEAMAAGKPIVASADGGVVEIIRPGIDGLLVPPDDENALASAISLLMNDETLRRDLGRQAVERSRDFTVERMATSFGENISRLAAEARLVGSSG